MRFRLQLILVFITIAVFSQQKDIDRLLAGLQVSYNSEDAGLLLQSVKTRTDLSTQEKLVYLDDFEPLVLEFGSRKDHISFFHTKAILLNRLSMNDSALVWYQKALDLAVDLNDSANIAYLLTNTGVTYLNQGKLDQAVNTSNKALILAERLRDTTRIIKNLNVLGSAENIRGNYEQAVSFYMHALELLEIQNDSSQRPQVLMNLAVINGKMGYYDPALKWTREACSLFRQRGNLFGMSNSLNNIGLIFQKNNHLDSAIFYYDWALKTGMELNDDKIIVSGYINKGKVMYESGDFSGAIQCFDGGIAITDRNPMIDEKMILLTSKAAALTKLKRYAEAESCYHQCLVIGKKEGYREYQQQIYQGLALVNKLRGNILEAYTYLEKSSSLKDSLLTETNQRAIAEMQTRFETEKKEGEINILTKEKELQALEIMKKKNHIRFLSIGAGLVVIILALIFLFNRMKQQKYRIEVEKKALEFAQRLLRTRVDPHFIFNVLDSIHRYISSNDNSSAKAYLARFAQLRRLIVERSRISMVTFEDEINTLQIYIELEKMRFKEKFEYKLVVDEQIQPERMYIPPMLVQPLVENAIRHGLSNLDRPGLLELLFSKNNGAIICHVKDNGIGRQESARLAPPAGSEKRSLGMELTRERLAAITKERKSVAKMTITDLADDAGNPSGTLAELCIPYEIE